MTIKNTVGTFWPFEYNGDVKFRGKRFKADRFDVHNEVSELDPSRTSFGFSYSVLLGLGRSSRVILGFRFLVENYEALH